MPNVRRYKEKKPIKWKKVLKIAKDIGLILLVVFGGCIVGIGGW